MKVNAKEYPKFKEAMNGLLSDLDTAFRESPADSHDQVFGDILAAFPAKIEGMLA